MKLRRCLAALVLAGTAMASVPAWTQVAPTHEVRRGDTLFAIARKAKHEGVSRNQMILAIWRANPGAFPGGNVNLLEVGTVLSIPPREQVAAIDPADADRQVRELLARQPQVAAVRPAAVAPKPVEPVVPLGQEQAARRYREGLALERKGDDRGALQAFLASGEAGYGLAQRKLGQIYDKGNSATQRDYQASLRWYQKAREQGVEIDKPLPRTTPAK
ncbi:MAG TPA: FimV/HubP family polar landmark protein [Burkholderiales bacterium]